MYGARLKGARKLICELTLRNGKVVWDLNGITRPDWPRCRKIICNPAMRGGMRSPRPLPRSQTSGHKNAYSTGKAKAT
jgi:hypothetical protein